MLLDGLEITQFTYFQQAGGMDLAPISVELTYGLERIAMHLQGKDDVYDLAWAPGVSYGDVRHREEVEQSKYAFGQVKHLPAGEFGRTHRDLFDRYYELGTRMLESDLTLPALDHCLKCSHTFNLLDASGSIGVTERAAYILRVRKLAVAIAEAHAAWERSQSSGAGADDAVAVADETSSETASYEPAVVKVETKTGRKVTTRR